jgi:succinyl-CoA synthetase beta subunit
MLGSELALDAEHAAQAVERLGRPAALKILSPDIAHKSDVGGVMLDVKSAEEARAAYAEIMHRVNAAAPGARLGGVLVTAMERGGVEVIVGTRRDPVLGPIVVFGLGGIAVEALNDVSLCLAPVDRTTALEMIEGVRASRLLRDFRGRSAADIVTLAEVIVRVSQLASDYADRIDSIEINPLLARPDGVVGLDALVALREGTT